ncbi:acylneuraminate cytidylyltransferase family protein [Clostridium fungisolvens]|uniref:N-acylneuraminate cytidylyltransferase n=1 Tax=Clostridium fungisolvens TaxID=1604897 RepID=A0A6V8SKM4_9CLOT|nr:acylneuraminate cytidylyltransferase family protein [Clostridium fungisolvens]GFP77102.1 N-acylneuraminate cytidylyltransferase [Clostridium fungisolvens]
MKYKHLAIIPARSGSKGIKDKNVKELNGKPMIAYTIEAAIKANIYDYIYVSTDSEVYADISKKYGAKVPFVRPDFISKDSSTTNDVIEYTINKFKEMGYEFENFSILQPTSPLRSYKHIVEANEMFVSKKANSVIGICEAEHSPLWCNTVNEDLSMENFIVIENNKNRQTLKKYYRINGAIYISNTECFLKYKNFYGSKSFAYIMDKQSSVDIDDMFDFKFAEYLLTQRTIN